MSEPKKRVPFWKIVVAWLVGVVALGISPLRDSIFATLFQWSILFVFVGFFIYREGAPRARRIFDGAVHEFQKSRGRRFALVTQWAWVGASLVIGLCVVAGAAYFCVWAWAISHLR